MGRDEEPQGKAGPSTAQDVGERRLAPLRMTIFEEHERDARAYIITSRRTRGHATSSGMESRGAGVASRRRSPPK